MSEMFKAIISPGHVVLRSLVSILGTIWTAFMGMSFFFRNIFAGSETKVVSIREIIRAWTISFAAASPINLSNRIKLLFDLWNFFKHSQSGLSPLSREEKTILSFSISASEYFVKSGSKIIFVPQENLSISFLVIFPPMVSCACRAPYGQISIQQ